MSDKLITTTKRERDSEGSIIMASYLSYCRESGKTQKYQKNLQELFFEYRLEGLKPRDALEKAKKVLSSFETRKN
jgi:hypothetical protein